ncbi:MAG TPA: MoxR family ATPase [Armatimonadota bacterium]|nr:MoxR family ATPase [Armatimonadota bacterium]HOM82796.1 MoxR family ATPase [Armatimonadota bacterium]HPO74532.1 MoxR family ATPase [Armatimonadota bacterium]HPT97785.1 MoxR family ATPase [Armatimonadota bacterium]
MSESQFTSIEEVIRRFEEQEYICPRDVAVTVYLAGQMGKPVLTEGPAGVGKTELAKVWAQATGRELIRLQCYEGLDESKALYEWEYTKQLLYTQMLKEKIGEILAGAATLGEAVARLRTHESSFFSRDFLVPRPLLRAILADQPAVLLIDEVDRADQEFEAFLLEVLSDFQVSVPELGTLTARHRPAVILTSNATRQLSEALRRRCLYLYMDYPSHEQEVKIVTRKVPGLDARLAEQAVQFVQKVRALPLRKAPSIGETLDWALVLVLLNARSLSRQVLLDSLNALLKDREDVEKVLRELGR